MTRIDAYVLYAGHDLHSLLDAAGIAPGPDVVGRVRRLIGERDKAISAINSMKDSRDRASVMLDKIVELTRPLGMHDPGDDCDVVVGHIVDALVTARAKVKALDDERADLARRLEAAEYKNAALESTVRILREERDALRPKPAALEWRGDSLDVNGEWFARLWRAPDECRIRRVDGEVIGLATSEESARRLAELLAGHDPGGRWTVTGHTVPVDVVRAVCGSVAVGWSP